MSEQKPANWRQIEKQRYRSVDDAIKLLKPMAVLSYRDLGTLFNLTGRRISQIEREVIWKLQRRFAERTQNERV